ncbi:hypothetical protein AQI95_06885 [Streptomyces yokosukanensis]|uniref:Uncharacterized protein n=1 Tax=Streptomyces yokosukanensis TaxID=67386 RepID=A0A117Q556_9ACTN|nr:hypothetical protein AQI95_06885 [Streptomyces yokosukanensis]
MPEIPISLSPEEAAGGTIIRLPESSGVPPISIPPVRDGDVVRIRLSGRDVALRVRVLDRPAAPAPRRGRRGLAVLVVMGVAALVVTVLAMADHTAGSGSSPGDYAGGSPSYSPTATGDPYPSATYPSDPYRSEDPYGTPDPYASSGSYGGADPYTSPSPDPSPYTSGTCLDGTLPNSTTAQSVSGVEEVSCSASDAHYKVIETIPLTSDMSRCNDNPRTQYAFSSRYTINGATINEYVYCLVGLGSYAR